MKNSNNFTKDIGWKLLSLAIAVGVLVYGNKYGKSFGDKVIYGFRTDTE